MRNLLGPLALLSIVFSFGCLDEHYWSGDCDWDGDADGDFDESPHPPVECVLSAECGSGERCVDGACRAPLEPMSPMTPTDSDPDPSGCMADRECAGGECVRGMCHAGCTGEHPICGTGQSCLEGICGEDTLPANECATSTDCGAQETCVDTRCFAGCMDDAQCTNPADFCDHGLCRPDWRPTTSCVYRSDCGETHCVDGQCRGACWADAECDDGVCSGGYCAPLA